MRSSMSCLMVAWAKAIVPARKRMPTHLAFMDGLLPRSSYSGRAATVKERYSTVTQPGTPPWVHLARRRHIEWPSEHPHPSTTSECFRGAPSIFDPAHRSPGGSGYG